MNETLCWGGGRETLRPASHSQSIAKVPPSSQAHGSTGRGDIGELCMCSLLVVGYDMQYSLLMMNWKKKQHERWHHQPITTGPEKSYWGT